jgi:hypothetical protein
MKKILSRKVDWHFWIVSVMCIASVYLLYAKSIISSGIFVFGLGFMVGIKVMSMAYNGIDDMFEE